MNKYIKSLFVLGGAVALGGTAQGQTINGWGADNGDVGGTTISDLGGGSFTWATTPTGSATSRAALPTLAALGIGDSLSFSGSFVFSTGSMGGGGFRIGISDYASLGTLSAGSWSTGPNATGYFWGLPAGGAGVTNPGGGEISAHHTGGGGSGWFSGNGGGVSIPGSLNNNASNITPNTYTFSLTLTRTGASAESIAYNVTSASYTESGTVTDSSATEFAYNGVGFFANTSDTALGSTVTFSGLTETLTQVPEPSTLGLMG